MPHEGAGARYAHPRASRLAGGTLVGIGVAFDAVRVASPSLDPRRDANPAKWLVSQEGAAYDRRTLIRRTNDESAAANIFPLAEGMRETGPRAQTRWVTT